MGDGCEPRTLEERQQWHRPPGEGVIAHVAIVGGGFSGSLAAINVLRHDGPRATLIDQQADAGVGLAYGAAHPSHLLNVRASNMSAFPDDPGHFVRWLASRGHAAAGQSFVPRLVYGTYLRELLDRVAADFPGRLRIVRGEAVDVTEHRGVRVLLADGASVEADAAVLAVGNLPPHTPVELVAESLGPGCYVGDCWSAEATEGLLDDDTVLILGTGLTMVDVVLLLEAKGFAGRIIALSRRGLLPHAHAAPAGAWTAIAERPSTVLSHLVRALRRRSAAIGWRSAIDELRPFTQDMWRAATAAERARFIRHARRGGTFTATVWPPKWPTASPPCGQAGGLKSSLARSVSLRHAPTVLRSSGDLAERTRDGPASFNGSSIARARKAISVGPARRCSALWWRGASFAPIPRGSGSMWMSRCG